MKAEPDEQTTGMRSLFEPDEVREVLRETFYRPASSPPGGHQAAGEAPRTGGAPDRDPSAPRDDGPASSAPTAACPPGSPEAAGSRARRRRRPRRTAKPDHYEVICISMYKEDLARLDAAVAELKRSGHRKISRSALIRFALATMDVEELPRPF